MEAKKKDPRKLSICTRCGWQWFPRKEKVIACPKCFIPETFVSGAGPIDKITGGIIWSATGNYCSIEQCHSHKNTAGHVITVYPGGCLPFTCTLDHELYVSTCKQLSRSSKRKLSRSYSPVALKPAGSLLLRPASKNKNSEGDYLFIPKLKDLYNTAAVDLTGFAKIPTEKAPKSFPINAVSAWVLGLYVAEGHATNGGEVIFSLGTHEPELIHELGTKLTELGYNFSIRPRGSVTNVAAYSRVLARAIKIWCGKDCYTKHVPEFIMAAANPAVATEFFRGYFRGDGCTKKGRPGAIASTASKRLALDIQLLGVTHDMFFGVTTTDRSRWKPSIINGRAIIGGVQYKISCTGGKFTKVHTGVETDRHNKSFVFTKDGVLVPINKVEISHYSGMVYNIGTSAGNYLVNNMAVKNCHSPYWDKPRQR